MSLKPIRCVFYLENEEDANCVTNYLNEIHVRHFVIPLVEKSSIAVKVTDLDVDAEALMQKLEILLSKSIEMTEIMPRPYPKKEPVYVYKNNPSSSSGCFVLFIPVVFGFLYLLL